MRTRVFACPLLVLGFTLAPPAGAQTPKQALKDFKQQLKGLVKGYKSSLSEAAKDLDAELAVFEQHFDDLQFYDDAIEDLVAALETYQDDAEASASIFAQFVGFSAADVLSQLEPGGPDENVHPVGLMCGDGGALDDGLAALDQVARKANAALLKKLDKLEKKLRKQTDMRLSIVLPPETAWVVAPTGGDSDASDKTSLGFDLLVGFDRGGVADDGRLWISGYTNLIGAPDLSIHFYGPTPVTTTLPASNQRWSYATDVQVDPLTEGNYLVTVGHGNGASLARSIGLP